MRVLCGPHACQRVAVQSMGKGGINVRLSVRDSLGRQRDLCFCGKISEKDAELPRITSAALSFVSVHAHALANVAMHLYAAIVGFILTVGESRQDSYACEEGERRAVGDCNDIDDVRVDHQSPFDFGLSLICSG